MKKKLLRGWMIFGVFLGAGIGYLGGALNSIISLCINKDHVTPIFLSLPIILSLILGLSFIGISLYISKRLGIKKAMKEEDKNE